MKKYIVLFIGLVVLVTFSYSQSLSKATISIDKVDISQVKPGEDVVVVLRLNEKSEIMIAGFQLFFDFDHDLFTWKGTWEEPEKGIVSFHEKMPYNASDWLFNDNGKQIVALWSDPKFIGIDVGNNDVLFKVVFTYNGGLEKGGKSLLAWGKTLEQKDGQVQKGPTEIYDENLSLFELTFIDGLVVN